MARAASASKTTKPLAVGRAPGRPTVAVTKLPVKPVKATVAEPAAIERKAKTALAAKPVISQSKAIAQASTPRKRLANADHDTRQRVLQTAVREFAMHGFDAPSIRDLTLAAGVNQAAINYHFGSKDGLIKTIFEELATPLIEERLKRLNELESQADGGSLPLETIIRIMVEPVVRRAKEGKEGQRDLAKLLLIASTLKSKPIESQIETMHDELALRFVAAICRAVPHLSRVEVMWRYKFSLGALLYTLSDHVQNHRLRRLSRGECDTDNPEEILDNLVPYLVAGFTIDQQGNGLKRRAPARSTVAS